MRRSVTVRVIQHRPVLGDLQANLADHRARVRAAAEEGVDLVVFPELSLTGYALGDLVDAVALDPGHARWPEVLALSEDVDVALGYVERGADGYLYNAGAYLHRGELLHSHRKTYLPTYGPFDEQRFFTPGRTIEAFDAPWGRAALVVCEEAWHPAITHGAVAQGAEVLLTISNAPGRGPQEGDWASQRGWRGILASYARLYAVWVVYANRVGYEEGFVFGGGSAVIAPDGRELLVGDPLEPDELTAALDPAELRRARIANPAHGIERHQMLIEALARAAAPEARAVAAGEREKAQP
ncbi:MAG TPA: nitrilase-related carbon-nitrogen hydrolase [Gemmatimonadota bacterium]|nr:nitrilase-related carbon-nitrogen hydrolase [Gemmatimonadota bacterium]